MYPKQRIEFSISVRASRFDGPHLPHKGSESDRP